MTLSKKSSNSINSAKKTQQTTERQFVKDIDADAKRKLSASQSKHISWFGLGMFGLIGWSITVPTIIGIAIGIWLDQKWSGTISWVLTLLIIGLVIGCMNAWYWLKQEGKHDKL